MSLDLASLLQAPRIKLTAALRPIAGSRFQPTGFPDLGPALYQGPDGTDLMLVESAQSMANHLEATLWDRATDQPVDAAKGISYVAIHDPDGLFLTSSRLESHRLASAYIKKAAFGEQSGTKLILERLGLRKGHPTDHGQVEGAIYGLDPLVLVHGAFFADNEWFGQPKIARALTAFVEALDVRPAHSGGVKFDHVSNKGDVGAVSEGKKGSEVGFGNVPFPRTEFVADRIEASFVIDSRQIAGYRLDQEQRELLLALALLEIRLALDGGLRLRTACDLDVVAIETDRPAGFSLPEETVLTEAIAQRRGPDQPPLVGVFG